MTRRTTLPVLFIASALALLFTRVEQANEPQRTASGRAPTTASGTAPRETVTVAADVPIPNVAGKRLVSRIIDYPPGARSVPHHHAGSAFIYAYVLSGRIRSQVNDEPVRVYGPGETWFESPGA